MREQEPSTVIKINFNSVYPFWDLGELIDEEKTKRAFIVMFYSILAN